MHDMLHAHVALPIDILLCIITAVDLEDDTRTLHTLCRTSRLLRDLATPALYRSIRVGSYGALWGLSRTLGAAQELGLHARSFAETHPFLYDEVGSNAILPGILKRMPYLTELRVVSPLDVDADDVFRHTPHLRTLIIARPTPSIVAGLQYLEAPLDHFEIGVAARQDQRAIATFLLRQRASVKQLSVDVDVLRVACQFEPNAVWQHVRILRLQGAPPQEHAPSLPLALSHAFPAVASVTWHSTSDSQIKPHPLAPDSRTWRETFWSSHSGQMLGGIFASVR